MWKFLDYTCAECEHYRRRDYVDGGMLRYCKIMDNKVYFIKDKFDIPFWCPKFTWHQKLIRRFYWGFHRICNKLFGKL